MTTLPRFVVLALRVLLALIGLGLVLGLVMSVPGQIFGGPDDGDLSPVRWPVFVALELAVLCLLVVVVCTWRLLTMVQADRIFSRDAFRWVDAIVLASVGVWLCMVTIAGTVSVFLYVTPELRDPGLPLLLGGLSIAAGGFVLLLVVMRALLCQATALRSDMDAVI
ncbi:DUF2975 domain-containing protein [Aeromicrobium massiliense]|uniref:DUF2975 domain-containing protein n=1 Tax=Aeromicrobium massiliense TaxID=1464554 RepID=UPI00031E09AC|nr:DUF2975 domain-containing protein [Aeromicrobium massiliense]